MKNFVFLPCAALYFKNTQSHSFYYALSDFLQYALYKAKILVFRIGGIV